MATQLQLRRGTTVENDGFTGALAEVTVDTDTHQLRVHDGSTQGGFVIPTESDMNTALGDKADASDVYDKATVDTALNAKAETDLGNITDGAKNIASWSSNVSNCITEIPQDINLELNAGTLTLKAGSKVYVPNGVGVFDIVNIQSDITLTNNSGNYTHAIGYNPNNNSLYIWSLSECYSGSTQPSANYALWYDTTNNLVKQKLNGVIANSVSFPIAIITTNTTQITSIDQVFNGFGYIGSTVFALPGVKGLIPNGRNADGTLNNTVTNDYDIVKTVQVNTSTAKIAMYGSGGLGVQTNNFGLNEQENFNYDSDGLKNALEVASVIVDSNAKITAFTPKTAFHAVDYNDTEFITHQVMPSNRYIDLPLGTSGTGYVAPADGYVAFTASGGNYIYILISGLTFFNQPSNANWYSVWCPVRKGVTFYVGYSGATGEQFRFIYAKGAK